MIYKSNDPNRANRERIRANIVCSAYVDDTWWASNHKEGMDLIVLKSQEFFTMNGIEINPKKTRLIVINERDETKDNPFMFGPSPQTEVKRSEKNIGDRLLGVFISADGKHKTQKEKIKEEVKNFITALRFKNVTDQQIIYLVNGVLIPALTYRTKLLPLTEKECETIDKQIARLVKTKCKLAACTQTSIIHQQFFYGIRKLWDVIVEDALTNYFCRINGDDITAKTNKIREEQLRDNRALPIYCYEAPRYCKPTGKNMNEILVNMLSAKNMAWEHPRNEDNMLTPLYKILPANVLDNPDIKKSLIDNNIRYVDQAMDSSGKTTLTWQQIHQNPWKQTPEWYVQMIAAISHIDPNNTTLNFEIKDEWQPKWLRNPVSTLNVEVTKEIPVATRSKRIRTSNSRYAHTGPYFPDDVNDSIDGRKRMRTATKSTRDIINTYYKDPMEIITNLNPTANNLNDSGLNPKTYNNFTLQDEGNLVIYTDGSVTNINTPKVSGGAGILIMHENSDIKLKDTDLDCKVEDLPRMECSVRKAGELSSYSTELTGIYVALKLVEQTPNKKVQIYTDSQSIVHEFEYQMNLTKKHVLKAIKSTQYVQWDNIRDLVDNRPLSVTVTWVKGHGKNKGNNHADKLAGAHMNKNLRTLYVFITPTDTSKMRIFKNIPFLKTTMIESKFRNTIKLNNHIKNSLEHTETPGFKKLGVTAPFVFGENAVATLENEWGITATLVHAGTKITSTHTTTNKSNKRTYVVKAFHNILPTQHIMKRRMPRLIRNHRCRCCNHSKEDNEHMWNCAEAKEVRDTIRLEVSRTSIENYLRKINPTEYNLNREKIRHALQSMSVFRDNSYDEINTRTAVTHFYHLVNGKRKQVNIETILDQGELTHFQHLCRGFAPTHLLKLIELLSISLQPFREEHDRKAHKAYCISDSKKFYITLLEQIIADSRKELWVIRCEITKEWEKAQGIEQKHIMNKRDRTIYEDTLSQLDEEGIGNPDNQEENEEDKEDDDYDMIPAIENNHPRRVDGDNTDDDSEEEAQLPRPSKKKLKVQNEQNTTTVHLSILAGQVPNNSWTNPSKKGNIKGR
jgi:ribonuclease HI